MTRDLGGWMSGCGCSRCVPYRIRRKLAKRARRRAERLWRRDQSA